MGMRIFFYLNFNKLFFSFFNLFIYKKFFYWKFYFDVNFFFIYLPSNSTIKRFSYDWRRNKALKSLMDVHFSPVVSLPMLPKDSSDIKESMKHRTYGLFAVLVHSGKRKNKKNTFFVFCVFVFCYINFFFFILYYR